MLTIPIELPKITVNSPSKFGAKQRSVTGKFGYWRRKAARDGWDAFLKAMQQPAPAVGLAPLNSAGHQAVPVSSKRLFPEGVRFRVTDEYQDADDLDQTIFYRLNNFR
ncbi:MAG: hypothetical protein ABJP70_06605 [Erythrobacter sp.]